MTKLRSAYEFRKQLNEYKKATLTDEAKTILDQLHEKINFTWYGVCREQSEEIEIKVLPSCYFNTLSEDKLNKYGKPFSFQGKTIRVIENPLISNSTLMQGGIHGGGGRALKISETGLGEGNTCAGGGISNILPPLNRSKFIRILRFRSLSHNSAMFKPHPLFVHFCARTSLKQSDITQTDIEREVPYQTAYLIAEEFQKYSENKFEVQIGLEEQQKKFEQMSKEDLTKCLQETLMAYVERLSAGEQPVAERRIEALLNDCKAEGITLDFKKIMISMIKSDCPKHVEWLVETKKIDIHFIDPEHGTFLDYSIKLKKNDVAWALVQKTSLKLCDLNQLLLFVIEQRSVNLDLIRDILEYKVDMTILHQALRAAVKTKPLDLIKLFFKHSYSQTSLDLLDETISEYVSSFKSIKGVQYLLEEKNLTNKEIEEDLWRSAVPSHMDEVDIQSTLTKTCLEMEEKYLKKLTPINKLKLALMDQKEEKHVQIIENFIQAHYSILPELPIVPIILRELIKKIIFLENEQASHKNSSTDFFSSVKQKKILDNLTEDLLLTIQPGAVSFNSASMIKKISNGYADINKIVEESRLKK